MHYFQARREVIFLSQRVNNYTIQAEAAREYFLKWNQVEIIRRFGPEHDDKFLYIDFFGEPHSISRSTGEVCYRGNGRRASFHSVMSIYDVLCYSKPGARLSGEWQTLNNLSAHSNFGAPGRSLHLETAKRYSGKASELTRACGALGGHNATRADVGFHFDAFSFLPVIFQFWDGDDEFDPKINFLFDSNTLDFIHFETAWYVSGRLLELIDEKL